MIDLKTLREQYSGAADRSPTDNTILQLIDRLEAVERVRDSLAIAPSGGPSKALVLVALGETIKTRDAYRRELEQSRAALNAIANFLNVVHEDEKIVAAVKLIRKQALEDVIVEHFKFKEAGRREEFDAADIRALL